MSRRDAARPPRRKSAAELEATIIVFNAKVAVGDEVEVTRDRIDPETGEFAIERRRTRTPAQLLSGHTPVVWIEGIAGCIALTHVRRI